MNRLQTFRGRSKRFASVAATATLISSLAVMGLVGTAGASVARYQIMTYSYSEIDYTYGSPSFTYTETAVITVNPCDGTFIGYGTNSYWGPTVIAGQITSPTTATYTDSYTVLAQTDYFKTVNVTLGANDSFYSDPSVVGQGWSDNLWASYGGPLTGTVASVGTPTVTSTSFANHGQYVKAMGGGDEAAHSCIGMPIQSQK